MSSKCTPSPSAVRPALQPHGTKPIFTEASLTCLFRKQHVFTTAQNLHSELPLYISEKERRVTVQGHGASWRGPGVGRPRKAVAWFLLLFHPSWAGRPQGPQPGLSEITGTSPHSDHIGRLHTSLKLCVCIYMAVSVCVSKLRLPARELSHIKPRSVCLAEMSLGLLGLPHTVLYLGCQLLSGMLTLGGGPLNFQRSRFSLLTNNCQETTA